MGIAGASRKDERVTVLRNVLRWTRRNGEYDRGKLSLLVVLPIMIVVGVLAAVAPPPGGDRVAPAVLATCATVILAWITTVANRRP
ncbi:MAG: hypothetical protein ACT4PX_12175 [Actinomycetota bacterium]